MSFIHYVPQLWSCFGPGKLNRPPLCCHVAFSPLYHWCFLLLYLLLSQLLEMDILGKKK